jgi:N-acylneuraminate cytidylyltransferase
MQKVFAIILARSGSKGIPNKNLQKIGGQSLLELSVKKALSVKEIDEVYVSSDSDEYLTHAEFAGALPIKRPAEIADDTSSSEEAISHAISIWEDSENLPDIICFLQCTSPFMTGEDISGTLKKLLVDSADSAFAAIPFHGFLWGDTNGELTPVGHTAAVRVRRQDMAPRFLETGAVYVFRTSGFLRHRSRFFGKVTPYIMNVSRALEIDTPDDLKLATYLSSYLCDQPGDKLPKNVEAVIMDFDGVLTDDGVYIDENGVESIKASRGDGMGLSMLMQAGIKCVVISKERNVVVQRRCEKLGVECYQAVDNKPHILRDWLSEKSVNPANCVYIGNDINDLSVFPLVSCSVAPADAHRDVLMRADIVLQKGGGVGAVRELCDMILKRK